MMTFNDDLGRRLRSAAIRLPLMSALALAVASPARAKPWQVDSALGTPDWLTLSGSHRTRYATLADQFRPGLEGRGEAVSLRTLLKAEIKAGAFTAVGELQDSRAYLTDEDTAISTIVVNAAELLQGYVGLGFENAITDGGKLDLQFGRMTMHLGAGRLVARNRFRNTIQNYTGLNAHWTGAGGSELTAFYVLPVFIEPSDLDGLLDNEIKFDEEDFDLRLWGLFYERPDVFLGGTGELYLFGLKEYDDPNERATRNRELYTPGFRFSKKPKSGEWDFDIENTFQFGSTRASTNPTDTRDLDVFAHFHHFEIGYTFKVPWSPRIDTEFDYASGESDTTDGKYGRYDTLFGPSRREFGPTGIFGLLQRANIISAGSRVSFKPNVRTDGYVHWRANFLEEPSDSFTRGRLRDPAGNSGRFAGHMIEARVRYWLVPDSVRWEVGGAVFLEGEFLEDAPNATGNGNPLYGYTDISFNF